MREQLRPYKGVDRLNYLCLIATEMLGESTLARLPALLAGFESVLNALPSNVKQALLNVRFSGFAPTTGRELAIMVEQYNAHHDRLDRQRRRGEDVGGAMARRFEVDEDFSITKQWSLIAPDDAVEALAMLAGPLQVRERALPPLQDTTLAADISAGKFAAYVQPLAVTAVEPLLYDIDRAGRAPGKVLWTDLVLIADRYDAIDVEAGRQVEGERTWYRRLHDELGQRTAELLTAGSAGLEHAECLDLVGLKHLIGLPGSGKTTLLYLLAGYLDANGCTACFLFPSIEVATGFIETLARYRVSIGLLAGQGETARNKHVLNFARSLAPHNRGYGVTRPVAPFFATNCALAGFVSDEDDEFPHHNPPCMTLQQRPGGKGRPRAHRCALSATCGYQHAERSLAGTRLWAGHILSVDRGVSKLFSDVDLRHFEFIARTFDLLVVDECDGAQNNLDARGTPIMKLVGDSESLWNMLIQELHQPAAGGRNAFVAGESLPALLEMTGRFGRAAERMLGRIAHLPPKLRKEKNNELLTSLSLLTDMYEDGGDDAKRNARGGLERIWDAAVKRVAFRGTPAHSDDEDEAATAWQEEAGELLAISGKAVQACYDEILAAIERWERDGNTAAVNEVARALRKVPNLKSTLDNEQFFAYAALLVSVSLVVLQHFGLAPHLRLMNNEGLVSDSVFVSRPSRDQLALLPESLIGKLSGVRFTASDEGNVDVAHVSFAGTPRLLAQRMQRLSEESGEGSMAVLLTSATSMLELSPSFHVDVGPHYVLRRPNAGQGWRDSRYTFLCKMDPRDGKTPMRFSGAKMSERESILKSIVDELLRGGAMSDVSVAINQNDVQQATPRKAGFVVNSYDQCELLYRHITANHPTWRGRIRYLTRAALHGPVADHAMTASDVEQLGLDREWDLLIFPMSAIGRGVNIVFQYGPRQNKAMLGSLFFLTRPHPRGDSLQLIQGLVGRASARFDQEHFSTVTEALQVLRERRRETVSVAEYLLSLSLMSNSLGRYAEPFVADQMIMVLQTIGRAMRGDCPAFVYFVDAAWAPQSALGKPDTERTSMLVMMQGILAKCLTHDDAAKRECYRNLYDSFAAPLNAVTNLIVSKE